MQWIVRSTMIVMALAGGTFTLLPQLGLGPFELPEKPAKSTDPTVLYAESNLEHYLTADQLIYIRPGLNIEIVSVAIPGNRYPVVELRFFDDRGQPLDREGNVTPGELSISFILAWYDGVTRQYTAYTTRDQTSPITGVTETQASSDSGGTWEDLGVGHARYTFGTQLPASYDRTRTHTLAIYATRDIEDEFLEKTYVENVTFDFRPDGGPLTQVWDALDNATCNRCHSDLAIHGGRRKDVKLCVTCHSAQSVDPDTGNTVDFKVMIHKIHRGANLPSVQAGIPYQIIGFRQSVHDYSTVHLPQDIRNCQSCHNPNLTEGLIWATNPAGFTCGSCHDDVNFQTGENHAGGAQQDNTCSVCHRPEGDREFDASVMGAHTIPSQSMQLAGLNLDIVAVEDTAPGQMPLVTFKVYNDDMSPVELDTLDRLRFRAAGPTTDIAESFQESVDVGSVTNAGELSVYRFTQPLPQDAGGTWSLSAEYRRNVVIDDGTDEGLELREAGHNPVFEFPVTDPVAVPRRMIVDVAKCNDCHKELALHGEQRFAIGYCVQCHNANATDEEVRPEEEMPPESIHFGRMIHRIHTGEELSRDFTVYGFRGSVHNYNELRYPGLRNHCHQCHVDDSYNLPLDENLLSVPTLRDFFTPQPPATAHCLGCHDGVSPASHAYVNIAPFGEACASCHGEDREFSVERSHAD